jgi:hypothetical protein
MSKTLYKTPHYVVYVGDLGTIKDTPVSMQVRYIIKHAEDGVIYGTAASIGQAMVAALEAESTMIQAIDIALEAEARGYAPPDEPVGRPASRGGGSPNFG